MPTLTKNNSPSSTWGEKEESLFKDMLLFCMEKGVLTVTEIALIFERPKSTVKFWVRGMTPSRIYRREAFNRLLSLEKYIKGLNGTPVIPYNTRRQDRNKYIQELADAFKSSNSVPTKDPT